MKKLTAPVSSRKEEKMTKMMMYVDKTPMMRPYRPSVGM